MSELLARLKIEGEGRGAEQAIAAVDKKLEELRGSNAQTAASQAGLNDNFDRTQQELRQLEALYKSGAISSAELSGATRALASRLVDLEVQHGNARGAMRATSREALNMGRQLADVGVMAAMGMNPLMILVSQGPQIADVFAEAKTQGRSFGDVMKGMAQTVGGAVLSFGPFVAVVGAAVGALALMAQESKRVDEAMDMAGESLERMQDEARDLAEVSWALSSATSDTASKADEAAEAYNRQANSAAVLAGKIRELNALQLGKEIRESEKRLKEMVAVGNDSGPLGIFRTSPNERVANAREALLKELGFGAMGDRTGQNRVPADVIAQARRNPGTLSPDARRLLNAFNVAEVELTGFNAAYKSEREYLARLYAEANPATQHPPALLDEITVSPTRSSRSRKTAVQRDMSEERIAQISKLLEQAKMAELQSTLALTKDIDTRARIEKELVDAQLREKNAEIDGQIASIEGDKGLSAARKAQLAAQLKLAAGTYQRVATEEKRAIDERADQEKARAHFELSQARRETTIDLLSSQADASRSQYEQSLIGLKILKEQHRLELERLDNVTLANGYTQNEVDIAQARRAVLEEIQANELEIADRNTSLLSVIDEAVGAVRGFKNAFKNGDWLGALNNLQNLIETTAAAMRNGNFGEVAMTLGSVAASAIGGRTGRAIGNGIGMAGMGLGIGAFAASGAGAAALATLGLGAGAISGIAALAGPIGLAAGALYAAAKLLNVGGKPSNNGAGFDLVSGQFSGNKRNSETENAAKSAGDAILGIQDALKAAGLQLNDTVRGLVIGTRDQTQIYLQSGKTLYAAVGDSGAAVDAALREILQTATYVSEGQKKAVEAALAAGKGFDGVAQVLAAYESAQDIPRQISDAILQLTDPKAWAVEELKRAQQDQRALLKGALDAGYLTQRQYDAAFAQLQQLESLQLADTLKQFEEAVGAATDALAEQATQLTKSVGDRILQLTDPKAYAVKQVNDDIDARRREAQDLIAAGKLGAEFLDELEKLRSLELADVMDGFAKSVKDASDALNDRGKSFDQSIRDRILELTNPDAYKATMIFRGISDKRSEAEELIAAGVLDSSILRQLEELQKLELADAFKEIQDAAGDATGALDAFAKARPRLLSWLDQLGLSPSAELSPEAARAEALRQYEQQLRLARAGDENALSNITSYADRLLSADRSATSSAADRLALFNRIQGEIGGLASMSGAAPSQGEQLTAIRSSLTNIATVANQQLQAEQKAMAEGGSRVLVSNLPALQDMYGAALATQTDALVAANDRNSAEVIAQLAVLGDQLRAALEAVEGAVANGAAVASAELAEARALAGQQLAAAEQLAEQYRQQAAYARARAGGGQ